jgi:hypothetical protein
MIVDQGCNTFSNSFAVGNTLFIWSTEGSLNNVPLLDAEFIIGQPNDGHLR